MNTSARHCNGCALVEHIRVKTSDTCEEPLLPTGCRTFLVVKTYLRFGEALLF